MINKTFGNLKLENLYHKTNSLGKYLKIDLFNSKAEDFTNSSYNSKEHKNDIFLFLDDNGKLVGVLRGKKWDKEFGDLRLSSRSWAKKTWDEFSSSSTKILRVPSSELKYTPRYNKKYSHPKTLRDMDYKYDLNDRLTKFKNKKYESLTYDDLEKKVMKINNVATKIFFLDSLTLEDSNTITTEIKKIFSSEFDYSPNLIFYKLYRTMESLWKSKMRMLEKEQEFVNVEIHKDDFETGMAYLEYKKYTKRSLDIAIDEYKDTFNNTKVIVVELERLINNLERIFLK